MSEDKDQSRRQWEEHWKYINDRWKQLYEMENEWGKFATNSLLLFNAGGAVATLSFVGTSELIRAAIGPKISLGLFLLGVIFAGLLVAHAYETASSLFKHWRDNADAFGAGELRFEEIPWSEGSGRYTEIIDRLLAYGSFLCFVLGALLGVGGLFCMY